MAARGWGEGNTEFSFNGYTVSVWDDETLWRWVMMMVAQQCERTYCRGTVYLKIVTMVNFILGIF